MSNIMGGGNRVEEKMRREFRIVFPLIILAGLLLYIAISHPFKHDLSFQCEVTDDFITGIEDTTLLLRLKTYHWWADLWGNKSDTGIFIETEGTINPFYSDIKVLRGGSLIQIYDYKQKLIGEFWLMSKRINLRLT